MSEATISMRLVRPFLEAAREAGVPPRLLQLWEQLATDTRIAESTAMALLCSAQRMTQDAALGVRAALQVLPEDQSDQVDQDGSASWRAARELLRLLHHHLIVAKRSRGAGYFVEADLLRVDLPQPRDLAERISCDFALAVAYRSHRRLIHEDPAELQLWFPYPSPPESELAIYRRVFGSKLGSESPLRFDAPRHSLIARTCDQAIHYRGHLVPVRRLLADYARNRSWRVPVETSFTDRVRTVVIRELSGGNPTADFVSSRLGVSRSTLVRRLDDEGVAFKDLLDHVRSGLAIRLLMRERVPISQIVRRLGYSDHAAFHKAFRRWFGQSPTAYLRSHAPPKPGE